LQFDCQRKEDAVTMKNPTRPDRGDRQRRKIKDKGMPRSLGNRALSNEAGGVKPSVWLLGLAVGLVGLAFIIGAHTLLRHFSEAPMAVDADNAPRRSAAAHDQAQWSSPAPPSQGMARAPEDVQQHYSPPTEDILPGQQEQQVDPAGIVAGSDSETSREEDLTGIHVFPPLGTAPLLTGIIVPDDFELPSGYVRHYQMTDDGRQLEPILMYHPDHPPLDWRGEPVSVPPDRVVTPDAVPKGLPINILEVPEPMEPSYDLQGLSSGEPSAD